jgi:hypothetical protein
MSVASPESAVSAAMPATSVTLPPGHRLVPASIGRPGRVQTLAIPCPAWCVEDHVGEPVRNVEDIMHRGDQSELCIQSVAFAPIPHQLYAYLASDPVAADPRLQATYIAVDNADASSMAFLTPEMAEVVAENAIRFAAEVLRLARMAREANMAVA